MWIEVKDDVLERAYRDKDLALNTAADFLRDLSIAVRKHKHVVYVPGLIDQQIFSKTEEVIGQQYTNYLHRSLVNRMDAGRIKSLVNKRVIVSFRDDLLLAENDILVNPDVDIRLDCYHETHVITENLADSTFYRFLINYYCRENNITNWKSCFYPLMGGGATSAKVLEAEIELQQHFAFAIADSDKRYPTDEDLSQTTASKMQRVIDEKTPRLCGLYVMKHVAEIENLIPHKYLREHPEYSEESHEKVFTRTPDYYDIKKGYNLRSFWRDDILNYWKGQFPEINVTKRDELKAMYDKKENYDAAAKRLAPEFNKMIDTCWGNSVLSDIIATKNLDDVATVDLTPNQQEEWRTIGHHLFSWTCCMRDGDLN